MHILQVAHFQVYRLRLQHLLCVALLTFCLGQLQTGRVHGAEDAPDPYDTLYDVIMTRYGADGKSYAENESSPTIFLTSDFPFGDKTYEKFSVALDAFAALPQTKIEAYTDVKRALLQLHLWKVFDVTDPHHWIDPRTGDDRFASRRHSDRRAALQPTIASLIRRLALTRAQILALPDSRAATVQTGAYAHRHDPKDAFKPFLPADLYAKESSWVCLGDDDNPIPAHLHTKKARWRSMFLTFMRVPGGRTATLQYMEMVTKSNERFPVGTQFALVEQAFLISDGGELVLSPLIVSIALRAYLDVERKFSKAGPPTQSVAEFVMQPRQLMKGDAVMKAIDPGDHRFETAEGFFPPGPEDPFESGRRPRHTRLNTCMECHSGRGIGSVQTVINVGYSHFLTNSGPEVISKATSGSKRDDKTWKALHELWR